MAWSLAGVLSACAVLNAAQVPEPPRESGASVTGAFEGWYENPDGSRAFLVGYYNRNTAQTIEIPIGPNNRIEPGGPDLGQPTHFLPGRRPGMFVVNVPKGFTAEQRLTWTLVVNGKTNTIPLRLHPDYVVTPTRNAASKNTPPVIRLGEDGPTILGGGALLSAAVARHTSLSTPLSLPVFTSDDAIYETGSGSIPGRPRIPVRLLWSKYRGSGTVTFDRAEPSLTTVSGGGYNVPFTGRATATARFSEPGDYVLHLNAFDYSGVGGGGEVCCWTTALVKVTVSP